VAHHARWFNESLSDLRFCARQLRKTPGLACIAIAVLALGIGAATAMYAFVDAALVRPLPYRDAPRLVALYEHNPVGDRYHLSDFDYRAWKQGNHSFSSLAVYEIDHDVLKTSGNAEDVATALVSDDFFRTLGVKPILGRDFYAGEDRPSAPLTTILSYAAWVKRFGADRSVLGRTVKLYGDAFTIVGVLPADFHFAPVGHAEIWKMLHGECEQRRTCFPYYGVARLRDGVSFAAAHQDVSSIAQQIANEFPQYSRDRTATMLPLADAILGDVRPTLLALLGAAGMIALIGFVNVLSLFLVRAENRRREIAVRGALGASRIRLLRQFALEGFLLAGVGCVLGLALGVSSIAILTRQIPPNLMNRMPYLEDIHFNLHMALFALALAAVGGVLFSAGPALHFLFSEMRAGLKEGGRTAAAAGWRKMGSSLVAIEIAVTAVLLIGAGLLTKSFYRLLHVDVGMSAEGLEVLRVASQGGWDQRMIQLEEQAIARASALPGVIATGVSGELALGSGEGFTQRLTHYLVQGRPKSGQGYETLDETVSVGYFETLRARLVRGRYFTNADDATEPPIVIVNRTMAAQDFPGEDAVGKHVLREGEPQHPLEIVGVVDDIKDGPLDMKPMPAAYLPFKQNPWSHFYLTVRSAQAGPAQLQELAKAIQAIDAELIVNEAETMTERIDHSETAYLHRSAAWVITGFATLALLLGSVGLYGVVSYSVGQRIREIGIRIALGAQRSSVYGLVLRESAWPVVLGAVGGILCSLWVTAFLRGMLFGVSSWDLETMLAVVGVLLVSAFAASCMPARRAASVDPSEALRAE
jgi:predicted permease